MVFINQYCAIAIAKPSFWPKMTTIKPSIWPHTRNWNRQKPWHKSGFFILPHEVEVGCSKPRITTSNIGVWWRSLSGIGALLSLSPCWRWICWRTSSTYSSRPNAAICWGILAIHLWSCWIIMNECTRKLCIRWLHGVISICSFVYTIFHLMWFLIHIRLYTNYIYMHIYVSICHCTRQ